MAWSAAPTAGCASPRWRRRLEDSEGAAGGRQSEVQERSNIIVTLRDSQTGKRAERGSFGGAWFLRRGLQPARGHGDPAASPEPRFRNHVQLRQRRAGILPAPAQSGAPRPSEWLRARWDAQVSVAGGTGDEGGLQTPVFGQGWAGGRRRRRFSKQHLQAEGMCRGCETVQTMTRPSARHGAACVARRLGTTAASSPAAIHPSRSCPCRELAGQTLLGGQPMCLDQLVTLTELSKCGWLGTGSRVQPSGRCCAPLPHPS